MLDNRSCESIVMCGFCAPTARLAHTAAFCHDEIRVLHRFLKLTFLNVLFMLRMLLLMLPTLQQDAGVTLLGKRA